MAKIKIGIWSSLVVLLTLVLYLPITAHADEVELNYVYAIDEYGNNRVVGFEYLNNYYSFEYDDRDIITYICDEDGNKIVYYCCDAIGNVTGIYSAGIDGWEINTDDTFIGNINKIRWLGYEYDTSSDCYIIGNRYFSVQNQKYLDGVDNNFAFSDTNPFLNKNGDGIMPADAYYDDLAAEEWKESLLASSTYNRVISYSSGWYNNLSTVELLARCIYAEGGTEYINEGNAVAWVILNRVHSSSFPNTPLGVITAPGQFSTVTGECGATYHARKPDPESSRWQSATYLACLMLTTTGTTEWETLVGNTINGQLYFYAYTIAKNNGGLPFSGTSSSSLYYNSTQITNVYVLEYGSVSSFTTLFANFSPTAYSRNIYYDYY